MLRCQLNPHLALLLAKATVSHVTAPLVHITLFTSGDLTLNNPCESAWQGMSAPTLEINKLGCLAKSVLLLWTQWDDISQRLLPLEGGYMTGPLHEQLHGSESATSRFGP